MLTFLGTNIQETEKAHNNFRLTTLKQTYIFPKISSNSVIDRNLLQSKTNRNETTTIKIRGSKCILITQLHKEISCKVLFNFVYIFIV